MALDISELRKLCIPKNIRISVSHFTQPNGLNSVAYS